VNISPPSDPKRRILAHLKRTKTATTQELARLLDMTDVAARQHLFALEQQGLVSWATGTPSGRGRPGLRWSLTAAGNDQFPDPHDALSLELIEAVKETYGESGLRRVLAARTSHQLEILQRLMPEMAPIIGRVHAVAQRRTVEGYMAEAVETEDDTVLLVEHHCPISEVAQSCPQICAAEIDLFKKALGSEVEITREQHLLDGDDRCIYRIAKAARAWPNSTSQT
jgi:predicted ArsR family transcriptional regulator